MEQYLDMILDCWTQGSYEKNRTNTDTIAHHGNMKRYDLSEGFPMTTTKKLHLKSVIHELLWFINGDTNVKYLQDNEVRIWNEWANEDGDLGPVYGAQWRNWNNDGIDQLNNILEDLKSKPHSRRHLVSAWNPSVLPDTSKSFSENVAEGKAALPPCHAFYQFFVRDGKLSCELYQRSADIFLGVPFNIASYALFTMMIAQHLGYEPGEFIHAFGDYHTYAASTPEDKNWFRKNFKEFQDDMKEIKSIDDSLEQRERFGNYAFMLEKQLPNNKKTGGHTIQLLTQLSREPKKLPTMYINPEKNLFNYKFEDFTLKNYEPHPHISGKVAI